MEVFCYSIFGGGAIFLINLPVVIIAFIGTLWVAPRHTHEYCGIPRPWDSISSLQVLITLSTLVAAIKECAATEPSWSFAAILLALSAISAILFTRRQSRLSHPLLDLSLFHNPAFNSGLMAAVFVTFATGGLLLSITQRFQWVEGFTPLQTGLLVSTIFIGSLPSGLLGGGIPASAWLALAYIWGASDGWNRCTTCCVWSSVRYNLVCYWSGNSWRRSGSDDFCRLNGDRKQCPCTSCRHGCLRRGSRLRVWEPIRSSGAGQSANANVLDLRAASTRCT